jgi:hypothetical protein
VQARQIRWRNVIQRASCLGVISNIVRGDHSIGHCRRVGNLRLVAKEQSLLSNGLRTNKSKHVASLGEGCNRDSHGILFREGAFLSIAGSLRLALQLEI